MHAEMILPGHALAGEYILAGLWFLFPPLDFEQRFFFPVFRDNFGIIFNGETTDKPLASLLQLHILFLFSV